MRVAVTGANGFVGAHLTAALAGRGHDVLCLSRSSNPSTLGRIAPGGGYTYRPCDVCDEDGLEQALAAHRAEVVYNCAVLRWRGTDPMAPEHAEHWRTNVTGAAGAARASARAGVELFLHSSAMMVFDLDNRSASPASETDPVRPAEPNGLSVAVGEQMVGYLCRRSGMNHAVLRYAGVYGPGKESGFVAKCITHMRDRPATALAVRTNRRGDFVWVDDVVRANLLALEQRRNIDGETLHIGGGRAVSVREIAETLRDIMGTSTPLVEDTALPDRSFYLDCRGAESLMEYRPRCLREGLKGTLSKWDCRS